MVRVYETIVVIGRSGRSPTGAFASFAGRFERRFECTRSTPPGAIDDSLLLAVIHSSSVPLVLLDGAFMVMAASDSFSRAFALDPARVEGKMLTGLGAGEWAVPQLKSLLTATATGHARIEAYEMDLLREGLANRRLVVNAQKLDHSDLTKVRLMLTIMDVTDARIAEKLKDDLLREKGILLQELQHRVAKTVCRSSPAC